MVATLPTTTDRLCRISSIFFLRSSILPHRYIASRTWFQQHRLASQRRDRILFPGFLKRSAVLCGQFRRRRYVQNRFINATYCKSGLIFIDTRTGGAPVTTFVYRACVIQGTQQIYVVALWYWGAALAKAQGTVSVVANLNSYPKIIVPLCIIVACLMWSVGVILFKGLPPYYRQAPGNIPSFYSSLFRRKIIIVRSQPIPGVGVVLLV